jgi:hypothetical protein
MFGEIFGENCNDPFSAACKLNNRIIPSIDAPVNTPKIR